MKWLIPFAVGFTLFIVSVFFMFSRPYTVTVIHHGQPTEIMLYRDFYTGLGVWSLSVLIMVLSVIAGSFTQN